DTGAGGSGGSGGGGNGGFYSGDSGSDGGAGVGVGVGGGGTGSSASAGGVGGGLGPLGPGVGSGGTSGGGVGHGGDPGPAPKWRTASALLRGAMSPETAVPPTGQGGFAVAEDDVRQMLALFAQLGKSRKDPEARSEVPNFQSRLSAMPVRAQVTLQQALAGLAA